VTHQRTLHEDHQLHAFACRPRDRKLTREKRAAVRMHKLAQREKRMEPRTDRGAQNASTSFAAPKIPRPDLTESE